MYRKIITHIGRVSNVNNEMSYLIEKLKYTSSFEGRKNSYK